MAFSDVHCHFPIVGDEKQRWFRGRHRPGRGAGILVLPLQIFCIFFLTAAAGPGSEERPKKVYYVGTVSYDHRETGIYSFDKRFKGGGSQKSSGSVNGSVSGTWGFFMECATDFAGIVLAAGESEAAVSYSRSKEGHGEYLEASEQCPGRKEAARPGALSVTEEREHDQPLQDRFKASVQLSATDGQYGILFVSEGFPVTRSVERTTRVTRRCNPSPPPDQTQTAVKLELPLTVASEPRPWGAGESVSGSHEVNDDEEGRKNFMPSEQPGLNGDYSSRTILSWSFTRKEADCTAKVIEARGEATLNDVPLSYGADVPLGSGDRIKVGFKGRAEFRASDGTPSIYRFGGGTDFAFKRDPCDPTGTKDMAAELLTGSLYSVISKFSGSDDKFMISQGTCASGVRGFLDRLRELFQPMKLYAAEPDENIAPESAVLPAGWPTGAAAFYLCASPDGSIGVKIFKGRAVVNDPATGKKVSLKAGEVYRCPPLGRDKPALITIMP